jgi:hypothetical protein
VLQMLTPDQQAKVQTFEVERRMGRMGAAGMDRGPSPGWWGGEHPPAGNPFREKRPGPPPKAGDEGAQGMGETIGPANR